MTQPCLTQPAEVLSFPDLPEKRLRRAMAKLEEALEEQGQALAGFRASMSELAGAVAGLDDSLQEYRGALDQAAGELERARATAEALDSQAEMLARLG